MSKLIFIAVSLLLLCSFTGHAADSYDVLLQKGNASYQQKQYDSAAYYFEQIAASKPQNAEVYYNLGNTYYRLNKIAPAVLNYERALKINPNYAEAKDNLLLTQNRIANRINSVGDIFFINWWQSLTRPANATAWAILALLSFVLIIVVMLQRRLQKGSRLPAQLPGIFGFICVCFLVLAFATAKTATEHNSGVVMQADAPLMSGELKGKPQTLVPEGTTVKIKSERGSWIEVSLPDGRNGWLQKNLIDKI